MIDETARPGTAATDGLDAAQLAMTGDMPVETFRAAAHRVADLMADYLRDVEQYAVLPPVAPGELTARLDGPLPSAADRIQGSPKSEAGVPPPLSGAVDSEVLL